MGYQPANYFNQITVSDELMKVATDYFNLALWISAISAALMAIAMIFYPLTKKQHAAIVEELKKRSLEESGEVVIGEEAVAAEESAIVSDSEESVKGESEIDNIQSDASLLEDDVTKLQSEIRSDETFDDEKKD